MSTTKKQAPPSQLTHRNFAERVEALRAELLTIGQDQPPLNQYPGIFSLNIALRALDELANHHRCADWNSHLHAQG